MVQTYATDAWGVPTLTQGSRTQPFGFAGEPHDVPAGLVYLKERYYDPVLGRFLSQDPRPGLVEEPGTLNAYALATNNPVGNGQVVDCADPTNPFYWWCPRPAALTIWGAAFGLSPGALASAAAAAGLAQEPPYDGVRQATSRGPRAANRGNAPLRAGEAGRFADLDGWGVTGDDLTPHHMPQLAANFTSKEEGGAIVLRHAEHRLTRTYTGRGRVVAQEEAGLPFRKVLARDIRDVRSIVGSRYNEGLRELIEYYRRSFPNLMEKL